jgi:hypothetical protein
MYKKLYIVIFIAYFRKADQSCVSSQAFDEGSADAEHVC